MIFQTSMTMVHVNLPGCTLQKKTTQVFFCHSSIIPPLSMTNSSIWHLDQRSEGMRTIDFDITRHQLPGKNSEKEQRKLQELAKVSRNLWCFCLDVWKTCFRGKKTFDNVKKCIHIKHVLHYETKKKLVSSYDRPIWIVSFKFKTRFEAILDCVERIVLLNHQFSHMRWAVRSFTNCSDLLLGRWIKPIDFSQYQ